MGTSISAETISSITDRVLPELEAHQEAYLYDQYRGRLPSPDPQGTKNKGVFPNDTALVKLVYLAYRNARRKWTMPVPNWGIISQQLAIKFEDRYNLL